MRYHFRFLATAILLAPLSAHAQSSGIAGAVSLSFGAIYPVQGYDGSYPTGLILHSQSLSGMVGMAAQGGLQFSDQC